MSLDRRRWLVLGDRSKGDLDFYLLFATGSSGVGLENGEGVDWARG